MREIVVVPHTHWDREWYEPFQRFRLRLVGLLDDVFERMERDPRQRFTLDGQLAAVDDYLEVRPEQRPRVTALVRAGRLAVGPWQILLDEFLCSGENIVRNLELGLARSADLGAAMPVGYLPDMFGHCAQMPQILVGAGLGRACVWRGVPAAVTGHEFAWVAPDGTAIRTEYLPGGYGNAAGLFDDLDRVGPRVAELAERMGAWWDDGEPLLAMYGTDHSAPAADLPDLLAAAPGLRLATLTEYVQATPGSPARSAGLPVVQGELRSHARANILPGVISARAHLKQAMSRAERTVERYAEPFAALWYTGSAQRFLDMAWSRLIEASCHDSVTGCGVDETAQQVAARMAEAEQLGRAVCDLAGSQLAGTVPQDAQLVLNPTPATRTGLVRLEVQVPAGADRLALETADGRQVPVQTLSESEVILADASHQVAELPMVLARIHGSELYGQQITGWSLTPDADGSHTLTFEVADRGVEPFDMPALREALAEAAATAPGPWRVRILAAPRRSVAALMTVPPLGYAALRPVPAAAPENSVDAPVPAARADGRVLDNGVLRVEVTDDGTLTVRSRDGVEVAGAGRLVDGGDLGDSYNYAPPAADRLIDTPRSVHVEPGHGGPLVATLDVVRRYDWPAAGDVAADGRAAATEAATVTTRVELRAGEPFVRLRVSFDNRCDDHRVRLHLPLPAPARASYAEGQFAVVERGLTAEGGGGEMPLPTFPASGFVAAGGLAVLLEHYTEYELVAGGRELAVTLLRSIGSLSRNRHVYRDEPAGPQLPTPQAQCRGERSVSLALLPYAGEWHHTGVLDGAEAFRHDLLPVRGTGPLGGLLPDPAAGLEVGGVGVVLTSVRTRDGWLEVRLVAEQPTDTVAVIRVGGGPGRVAPGALTEARRADLLGRAGDRLPVDDGTVTLPLRAWEIATVQLRRADHR